jgi:two-component system, NarL family, nitrate/nitrite response regulator NarL
LIWIKSKNLSPSHILVEAQSPVQTHSTEQHMSTPYLRAGKPSHADRRSASSLRIVLVTAEPLYREGIQRAFHETQSLLLLDGTTMADAVELAKSQLADMAVIDTTNLGQTIEMAKCLAPWCPDMSIVAVMDTAAANEVKSAFAAGIRGCIFKRVDGTEFVRILESIGHGGFYVPPELGAGLLRQEKDKTFKLTPRETQILACVERGLTNKEIARELQISEKTVKHYMTVIMEKLQVRNRVEAALKAKAIIEC